MDSKQIYDFVLKIQSIAKIGLIYSKDPYALTNYKEINDLSTRFLEEFLFLFHSLLCLNQDICILLP